MKKILNPYLFVTFILFLSSCEMPVPPVVPTAPLNLTDSLPPTPTTTPRPTITPRPTTSGTENMPGDETWINSYPQGAQIYAIPVTVSIQQLELDDVVRPENLLGAAPIKHKFSPGMYYLVASFDADLYPEIGIRLPAYSDPSYDYAFPFDGNRFQSMSFSEGEYIERISKVYQIDARDETLISIALPLAEQDRGLPRPNIYPTLNTVESLSASFTFNDSVIANAIQENLNQYNLTNIVSSNLVDEMVEVLRRVGKVRLDTNDVDMIVQLNDPDTGTFSISIYGG
jgi:hypothetical protein